MLAVSARISGTKSMGQVFADSGIVDRYSGIVNEARPSSDGNARRTPFPVPSGLSELVPFAEHRGTGLRPF